MVQRDRGGLGKVAGGVALPGTAPVDGVEQLRFRGYDTNSGELLTASLCTKQRGKESV